jgi:molybdopterin/thiamine biosynthesis adenylyltransferase
MARRSLLKPRLHSPVIVRVADPELAALTQIVFSRYPHQEWATFLRFGWRDTPSALVLTLAFVDGPTAGDLDSSVSHVALLEPYTLRVALAAEGHALAIGIIHSHPRDSEPRASSVDDDMDSYYASYFGGFIPGRPYVSLIASQVGGSLTISGRVFWRNEWLLVNRVLTVQAPLRTWVVGSPCQPLSKGRERTARLNSAFGQEAANRLRAATVAVIGAGGTGSAAIEVLARAGVGRIIVADPDHLDESNLERVHGSRPEHAAKRVAKAQVALEHISSIDPSIEVAAFVGALPQDEILDEVVKADVTLGCTDQQHSRLALSDIAFRYLVPGIDCGVALEGRTGTVTAQVVQLVRFLPSDPCALCRQMVTPQRLSQELMSEDERGRRRIAAAAAEARGDQPDPYWRELPQLNTVGYLTAMAGALSAGYAIGWITGRFTPPFARLQLNLSAELLDVTEFEQDPQPDCACRRAQGWADQGIADALISPPPHWPRPRRV